jgi:hypothetical protein
MADLARPDFSSGTAVQIARAGLHNTVKFERGKTARTARTGRR